MRLSLPLLLLLLAFAPACKQGDGERCQIDDDCSSGLECSNSQHICVPVGVGTPDAVPVSDARPDGPTPDGGPDAPDDAAVIDGLLPDI
jgi:hypothetical protein